MTKKVIWVLDCAQPNGDTVDVFASWEAANAVARDILRKDWEASELPGPMPHDHVRAIDMMQQDAGYYSDTYVSVTHHTIETDALADA